ncbi:aminoacyl-tRNA deacylase and HDOD domain-containing protein [Marinobacterium stanieri]|uniref:HD-like signal output (HDOD) domain, no enzymatic activity n=1 Tax=Marinobacterium stanieri TaxID=49186 RepID=A0A1N6VZT0_9GAMM|nr:HDOD domain-containing protein [Marinobacterium stanieri]SIQ83403.1 HD-like signal output (HDOD) domain, no enzymatic activity [Marinobacterium stanieri]
MSLGVSVQPLIDTSAIRLVLLHDRDGKLLALLPGEQMLDLTRLAQLTGRDLQPVKGEDAKRFFAQPGMQTAAGLEKLLALPLALDSGCPEGAVSGYEPHTGWSFQLTGLPAHEQVVKGTFALPPQEPHKAAAGAADEVVITRAVEKFTSLRVKQRLEDTLSLPGLSESMQLIVKLRSDPSAGVDDLVPVIKRDPSLSAQVMGWASSPYYAAPGKVRSIEDAIIRVLGFDLVVNLALGVAMGQVLKLPDDTPRGAVSYWDQAIYTATLAEMLAQRSTLEPRPRPGIAYLGGLLHNFGYLVLGHLFPPHFSRLSRYIEANPHLEQRLIEQEVLHVTREQVGGWLLDSWKLPSEVCTGVRYQQEPELANEEERIYAQLIYQSSRLLRSRGLSDGPHTDCPEGWPEALGLTPEQVQQSLDEICAQTESLAELSGMFHRGR